MTLERYRFQSRCYNILVACAASFSINNILRYPSLVYKYNGGSTHIVYICTLLLIGLPLFSLEISLGYIYKSSSVISFYKFQPSFQGVALSSLLACFLISSYFITMTSYSMNYIVYSFYSPLPWGHSANETFQFFDSTVTKSSSEDTFNGNNYAWNVIIGMIVCILSVSMSNAWGVKYTYIIMSISFIIMIILLSTLLVLSLTLNTGSLEGLYVYIQPIDVNMLFNGSLWLDCCESVIMSYGIVYGVICILGSYSTERRGNTIIIDSILVIIINYILTFISGIMVFCVIGHTSSLQLLDTSNISLLLFQSLPVIWETYNNNGNIIACIFYSMITLGMFTNILAYMETLITSFEDLFSTSRFKLNICICVPLLCLCFIYASSIGNKLIHILEYYLYNYLVLLVGLMESIYIGWIYDINMVRRQIGAVSIICTILSWSLSILGGIALCLFLSSISNWLWALGLLFSLPLASCGSAGAYYLSNTPFPISHAKGRYSILWWLLLGNAECSRFEIEERLNNNNEERDCSIRLTVIWSICMKYVIPILLLTCIGVNIYDSITDKNSFSFIQLFGLIPTLVVIICFFVPYVYTYQVEGNKEDIIIKQLTFNEGEEDMLSMTSPLSNITPYSKRDDGTEYLSIAAPV